MKRIFPKIIPFIFRWPTTPHWR